jgi:thiol-disulfide isomerase/thioredoxin
MFFKAGGFKITRLLIVVGVGMTLTACDRGDKGNAPASQASYGAAQAAALPINTIDRSHAGTPAPTLAFQNRGGSKASMADYKGKRVLVNLWATWCAPCIAEMPELDALAAQHKGKLTILPISQDAGGWKLVEKFFAAKKFVALEPKLDADGEWADKLMARGLPMSVLYDEKGREVWRVAGTLEWGSAKVAAAL